MSPTCYDARDVTYLRKRYKIMRKSGVLMPVFSLPGNYGIGTMGKKAYEFVDFLKEAGQKCWQVLPLGQTGYGNSPYQTVSAFGGSCYLIDLDMLIDDGLLDKKDIDDIRWNISEDKVDFGLLYLHRMKVLKIAFKNFDESSKAYKEFLKDESFWIKDLALFMSLKDYFGGIPFAHWPMDVKKREKATMDRYESLLDEDIRFNCFIQYMFFKQWKALKEYANESGIEIIGDIPIYVPADSVDVWANPEFFQLDEKLVPESVAGVPPDYFSEDGQLWGNPLYDWDALKKDDYSWWMKRLSNAFKLFDIVRIDHFRGIESYWSVKNGEETAKDGKWCEGPGEDFIKKLQTEFSDKEFIAEDLGILTDEVKALLEFSGYPGMKVLEFAFEEGEPSDYLPHRYERNCVCYTGTHDNETLMGWLENSTEDRLKYVKDYFGITADSKKDILWSIIRAGMRSHANLFIAQLQDYLELDNEARINKPGISDGTNWCWRMREDMLTDTLAIKIKSITEMYER